MYIKLEKSSITKNKYINKHSSTFCDLRLGKDFLDMKLASQVIKVKKISWTSLKFKTSKDNHKSKNVTHRLIKDICKLFI